MRRITKREWIAVGIAAVVAWILFWRSKPRLEVTIGEPTFIPGPDGRTGMV